MAPTDQRPDPSDPHPPLTVGVTSSSVGAEGAADGADWMAWERDGRVPPSGEGSGWATRAPADAAQLAALGIGVLRLTLEWARLEPAPGQVDPERVEHERRVLTSVREAGLEPWATLHHGSLPGWFAEDEGGFADERARSRYWPRHVDRCGEMFEDLVAGWVPIEDPVGWAVRGFLLGTRPPGRSDPLATRDALLGALDAEHEAWRLLRSGRAPVMAVRGLPLVRPLDDEARTEASHWERVVWRLPLRARREGLLEVPGGPVLERPEMAGAFDLVGIRLDPPMAVDRFGTPHPWPAGARTDATGLAPDPATAGEVLRRVADELPGAPLVVAADGVATTDEQWRADLLRRTLEVIDDARAEGIDVRGYQYETGVDGYEWQLGFSAPRGLLSTSREPKPAAVVLGERLGRSGTGSR